MKKKFAINIGFAVLSLSLPFFVHAQEQGVITISSVAEYVDQDEIQTNVLEECPTINADFSKALKSHLEEQGYKVNAVDKLNPKDSGLVLDAKISSITSTGNAFMGHQKSMSSKVVLYKDGEKISSRKITKGSNGGFGGAFKSSCAVVAGVANAITVDITRWMKDPK